MMRGLPEEVLAEAFKVAQCLQERESVEIQHGYSIDQSSGYLVAERPTQSEVRSQHSFVRRAHQFSFWVDDVQYWVPATNRRRIVSTIPQPPFAELYVKETREPYADFPQVQWEYLDPE